MRLLERFNGTETHARPADRVAASICTLLTANPGFGSIHPDFGLEELSRFATDQSLEERLTQLIGRWEPRFEDPQAGGIGRDPKGRLHIRLEGIVEGEECVLLLMLNSHLNEVQVVVES